MKGLGTRLQSPFFGMFCFINADVLFPNKLTHPFMHRLYFDISPILLNVFYELPVMSLRKVKAAVVK